MIQPLFATRFRMAAVLLLAASGTLFIGSLPSRAQEATTAKPTTAKPTTAKPTTANAGPSATPGSIAQGQRVFSVGHSFHVFMPAILRDIAQSAEIKDHLQLGLSSIGGSRVIQHWNVPDDKFKAKEWLRSGKVDVLTLAPIYLPDEGIENFVTLALEHNPDIRITVQEFWLPFDLYEPTFTVRPKTVDHNSLSIEQLRERHEPYFASVDEHVRELNQKVDKTAVFVVPVGQAVLALREKIVAGEAPGLATQEDLFTDAIGHARPPLQALAAYCHFAVTYRRSPVGLPVRANPSRPNQTAGERALVTLLQQLAWEAAIQHPLSGVKAE